MCNSISWRRREAFQLRHLQSALRTQRWEEAARQSAPEAGGKERSERLWRRVAAELDARTRREARLGALESLRPQLRGGRRRRAVRQRARESAAGRRVAAAEHGEHSGHAGALAARRPRARAAAARVAVAGQSARRVSLRRQPAATRSRLARAEPRGDAALNVAARRRDQSWGRAADASAARVGRRRAAAGGRACVASALAGAAARLPAGARGRAVPAHRRPHVAGVRRAVRRHRRAVAAGAHAAQHSSAVAAARLWLFTLARRLDAQSGHSERELGVAAAAAGVGAARLLDARVRRHADAYAAAADGGQWHVDAAAAAAAAVGDAAAAAVASAEPDGDGRAAGSARAHAALQLLVRVHWPRCLSPQFSVPHPLCSLHQQSSRLASISRPARIANSLFNIVVLFIMCVT